MRQRLQPRRLQARDLRRAVCKHKTDPAIDQHFCQVFEQVVRKPVDPVQVFHHDQDRLIFRCRTQTIFEQRRQRALAVLRL